MVSCRNWARNAPDQDVPILAKSIRVKSGGSATRKPLGLSFIDIAQLTQFKSLPPSGRGAAGGNFVAHLGADLHERSPLPRLRSDVTPPAHCDTANLSPQRRQVYSYGIERRMPSIGAQHTRRKISHASSKSPLAHEFSIDIAEN
jgi:hypothetical protein